MASLSVGFLPNTLPSVFQRDDEFGKHTQAAHPINLVREFARKLLRQHNFNSKFTDGSFHFQTKINATITHSGSMHESHQSSCIYEKLKAWDSMGILIQMRGVGSRPWDSSTSNRVNWKAQIKAQSEEFFDSTDNPRIHRETQVGFWHDSTMPRSQKIQPVMYCKKRTCGSGKGVWPMVKRAVEFGKTWLVIHLYTACTYAW